MTNQIAKKILIYAFVFLLPILVFAEGEAGLLTPDCDGVKVLCNFGQFFQFIKDIIQFLIYYLSVPIAIILIVYAGWLYLTTGISDNKSKAKAILWAVLVGFAIMLGAWLVIDFILDTFIQDSKFTDVPNVIK